MKSFNSLIQDIFRLPLPARCHGYYVKFTRRCCLIFLIKPPGASNIQATKLCLYSQEYRISDTVYGTLYYFYKQNQGIGDGRAMFYLYSYIYSECTHVVYILVVIKSG